MNKILTLAFVLISVMSFGQKFESEYNTVIDFDGKQRRVYQETGKMFLTDSLLINEYPKGPLVFKVFKISSNKVYYYNQFEETIKVLFMGNGDVVKINETRPDEYIIYRKK